MSAPVSASRPGAPTPSSTRSSTGPETSSNRQQPNPNANPQTNQRRTLWSRMPKSLRRAALCVLPTIWFFDNVAGITMVEGRSMQPTLNPDSNELKRDWVFLDKWSIRYHKYRVGDVVIATAPDDAKLNLVKRLVALPFDLVRPWDFTRKPDKSAKVDENRYLSEKIIEILPGRCWLESDERFHGHDSNYYGPIPLGLIKARVAYVIWPRFVKVGRGEWEAKSKLPSWEQKETAPRIAYRSGGEWIDRGID